jgi:nucleotide-binding universal stress UspA family protein
MINKIIFPTDFSSNAAKAMHFAAEVAQFTGAELLLLHAQHIPSVDVQDAAMIMDNAMHELKHQSEIELTRLKEILERDYFLKKVTTAAEFGFARDLIIDTAEDFNADLVVMGTKGSSNLLDSLLGGITANVMKGIKRPLLVVPSEAHYHKFKKIAFASLLDAKDIEQLDWFADFTKIFNPEMHLLHVVKDGHVLDDAQRKVLEQMGHKFNKMIFEPLAGASVSHSIEDYLESEHIELLAMRTGERNFFEELFHNSVTKHIAMHTQTPLIIFH